MINQNDSDNPNTAKTSQSTDDIKATSLSTTTTTSKEQEPRVVAETEGVKEVSTEIEIPPEIEKTGITIRKETVEIPPDVAKLGLKPSGTSIPMATGKPTSAVVLPIADSQVLEGIHAKISTAIRWLAEWCLRKLKKAHIVLKKVHGKVVRVKDK